MALDRLHLDLLLDALTRIESEAGQEVFPETRPLGRFQVRGMLGVGRFAIVALADDPSLNRQVALKLPKTEILADEKLRARFLREAQVAARLDHPGIVPIFEIVQASPEVVFLVLGYVAGPTLESWVDENPKVPNSMACQLVAALADAVQHAHERKVLHLDLKPSNVLIEPGHGPVPGVGRPRVTDFGLARIIDGSRPRTTVELAGTPGFMAPEQLAGARATLTERTDVWALGAILYQVLTGYPPYTGDTAESAIKSVAGPPTAPRSIRPEISPDIEAIVLKCLRYDPSRRYASAAALAADLRATLVGTRPTAARWSGPSRRAAMVAGIGVAACAVVAVLNRKPKVDSPEPTNSPPAPQSWLKKPKPPGFTNSVGMNLIWIEPGEFTIGTSEKKDPRRQPHEEARQVRISRGYFLAQCEVTIGQFRYFAEQTNYKTQAEQFNGNGVKEQQGHGWDPEGRKQIRTGCTWRWGGYPQTDDEPVGNVTWYDAGKFCDWLSQREGRKYRLPTEAEWEYACRAGTKTPFFWGEGIAPGAQHANFADRSHLLAVGRPVEEASREPDDGYALSAPVGRFEPNAWGLYDMSGNVWEWCEDWWGHYADWPGPAIDPVQNFDRNGARVLRGGSYGTYLTGCRSAHRCGVGPTSSDVNMGFRVVCEVTVK